MGVRPLLQALEDSAAQEEGDSSVVAHGFTADTERHEVSSHGEPQLELDAPSHSSVECPAQRPVDAASLQYGSATPDVAGALSRAPTLDPLVPMDASRLDSATLARGCTVDLPMIRPESRHDLVPQQGQRADLGAQGVGSIPDAQLSVVPQNGTVAEMLSASMSDLATHPSGHEEGSSEFKVPEVTRALVDDARLQGSLLDSQQSVQGHTGVDVATSSPGAMSDAHLSKETLGIVEANILTSGSTSDPSLFGESRGCVDVPGGLLDTVVPLGVPATKTVEPPFSATTPDGKLEKTARTPDLASSAVRFAVHSPTRGLLAQVRIRPTKPLSRLMGAAKDSLHLCGEHCFSTEGRTLGPMDTAESCGLAGGGVVVVLARERCMGCACGTATGHGLCGESVAASGAPERTKLTKGPSETSRPQDTLPTRARPGDGCKNAWTRYRAARLPAIRVALEEEWRLIAADPTAVELVDWRYGRCPEMDLPTAEHEKLRKELDDMLEERCNILKRGLEAVGTAEEGRAPKRSCPQVCALQEQLAVESARMPSPLLVFLEIHLQGRPSSDVEVQRILSKWYSLGETEQRALWSIVAHRARLQDMAIRAALPKCEVLESTREPAGFSGFLAQRGVGALQSEPQRVLHMQRAFFDMLPDSRCPLPWIISEVGTISGTKTQRRAHAHARGLLA